MFTESVILALVGGVAGGFLAVLGIGLFRDLGSSLNQRLDLGPTASFPRLNEIQLDATAFTFTLLISILTGVAFGLMPAFQLSSRDLMHHLRENTASRLSAFAVGRASSARYGFVVAEIALAMVLLIGGGLLIHSFVKLSRVESGFDPTNVLTFQVRMPPDRYSVPQLRMFAEDLISRIRAVSESPAAGHAHQLPMVQVQQKTELRVTRGERVPSPPGPAEVSAYYPDVRLVSRDFLKAMGMRIVAGRGFAENDGDGNPRVLLINEAVARIRFRGENPVGKQVYVLGDRVWEIVGVVADVRQKGLAREPDPQIFADFRQWPRFRPGIDVPQYYAVRFGKDPASAIPDIRNVIRQMDPQATLDNVATMEQLVSASISRERLYAVLFGIFAAVAVGLASIGIYGVMAYSVSQRTREMGIRMALGARPWEVLGLVLRQGLILTAGGVALGVAGATAVTKYLSGMLFGLTPLDLSTFLAVVCLFSVVATAAVYVPARRATKIDPIVALRYE
jgi:putative ABC transport system permease protein